MLAPRPLEIFLLVVCAAGSFCTDGEQELSSSEQLNQADAEVILSAQTALRRYFIEALANLQEYITGFNPFYSVVNGILQGLRSRDLDPLKSFRNGYDSDSNQSAAYRMAAIVCSMQGCSSAQTTPAEWRSLLQTIPHIADILPPQPIIPRLTPRHLHKANADSFPDAALLLIQQNHLKLTDRLLIGVLYNYPFKNHSPDLDMAVDSFIRKLQPLRDDFRPDQTSAGRPDEILSDIIRFILQRQRRQDGPEFEAAALLSVLSNRENVEPLKGGHTPWELFELVRDDDYPPDIVRAARDLAAAVKNNRVNVAAGSLKGYSPLQKLLGLISQLAGIPTGDPLSELVHGIYPHVKLRYLSSKGQFFHPQTSSDVAFLLNSFLTVPSQLLLREVHDVFLLPEFNWRMVLSNFDYSKYSKPRSLLRDMLQELLRNSNKLPTCDLILFGYFLRNYSQVPIWSPYRFDDDVIGEKLNGAKKPLRLLPDLQEKTHPTDALETAFPKCSNGPAIELVDPDSIIEIFNTNTALISDLIRLNPMPVDRYPNKTRAAVLRSVINNFRTGRNNSRVAESVIQHALMRVPLNEKANSPPRYLHLCPLQDNAQVLISQAGQQQPVIRPKATSHEVAASSVTVTPLEPVIASTTASSMLVFTATTTLQPSIFLSSVPARGSPPASSSLRSPASSRPPSPPPAAVTTLPITTASMTIAAVNSSSSTSDASTINSLSSSSPSDTTITVSPTAPTAIFPYFLKNTSALPPSSQQPLPVYTAQQQSSPSFPNNPASTPPQPLAVESSPFSNSTL